ncbi:NAD(P)-binding protein [Paradesulfitobacterium ferrireducens]|uniref:NAD(P)-binding protein n=1 Tax=Paradesulfitobacterium ferrireducens TaxID=2816476 RepID=UPI001A8D1F91|nr:NAD(P)-binding protein [Paradesulfitobacterium ferrireducens]
MPEVIKEVPPIWTTGWTDILNTGTWRSAVPVHKKRPAPCHKACPVEGEIPVWTQLVKAEKYQEAWLALAANNPFPAVTGRVCHHPCEGSCNRGEYDGAVAINALEHYVGDLALQEGWSLPKPEKEREQRVLVIGAGPAGLSCAYRLRLEGYQVTVFEEKPEAGGVLRYGIPQYRLPKAVLAGEIKRLQELGISIETGRRFESYELEQYEQEYDAVFLAIGAGKAKSLPQFPSDKRVLNGLEFLARANQNDTIALGQQVVVVGGGSVAMDVARTARRLGSYVTVLALEDGEHLPAQTDEVTGALEEGIAITGGAMVQEVQSSERGLGLACVKVNLDPEAPPGVLKPVVVPGSEFSLIADQVILAIGQDPETDVWNHLLPVKQTLFQIKPDFSTDRPGVFAGGDDASAERYVSSAIGQGKMAARSIARYLTGGSGSVDEEIVSLEEPVPFKDINTFYFPSQSRDYKGTTAAEQRVRDFSEVKTGFSSDQALAQAERCFSCGSCIECDNCFYFCPDMAVVKDATLEEHYRILDQYCKGCGSCVEECPRGAVVLKEESR